MQINARLYELTQETQCVMLDGAIALRTQRGRPPFGPLPPLMQVRRGYAESPTGFVVQAAAFTPEPLTVHQAAGA